MNGTGDANTMAWPDCNSIIATFCRKFSKEEEELCEENFEELYVYVCKNGNIPDKKWYELGFTAHKNADGGDFYRNIGIS